MRARRLHWDDRLPDAWWGGKEEPLGRESVPPSIVDVFGLSRVALIGSRQERRFPNFLFAVLIHQHGIQYLVR